MNSEEADPAVEMDLFLGFLPPTCTELYDLLMTFPQPGSFELSLGPEDEDAQYALYFATTYLGSAIDALQTFYTAAKSKDPRIPHLGGNGMVGLLRQALENTAWARWLLTANSLGQLRERGAAARWDDEKEQERYRCAKEGLPFQWNRPRPPGTATSAEVVKFLPIDELIRGDMHPPTPSGYETAAPLYSWSSGATHGKAWATLASAPRVVQEQNIDDKNILLLQQQPDYTHIFITLAATLAELKRLTERLARLRVSPAEAAFPLLEGREGRASHDS